MNASNVPGTSLGRASVSRKLSSISGGCVFWLVFCIVALLLRGVRWDEDFEFAQAMTGMAPYPDGHPLPRYTLGAYNLQFYSTAALMLLTPDPAVVNGFRNLLFIAATTLPVYLLGIALSGRALVGHCAVVLVLFGLHLDFDGIYPQFIWPGMFSNGHVGMGWALTTVILIAMGKVRGAAFMVGLLPAVHLGQLPPVLWLAGLYALWIARRGGTGTLKRALPYLAGGLVFCAAFLAVQRAFALPPPDDGPYASDAAPSAVWHELLEAGTDMHRSIPVGNSHLLTAGFMVLAALGLVCEYRSTGRRGSVWQWLTLYGLGVVLIVYGIISIHLLLGPQTPYFLIGWLPYRLYNHLPPVLLAMCLTVVATKWPADTRLSPAGGGLAGLVIITALVLPLLSPFVPTEWYERFFSSNAGLFFFLFAAAFAKLAARLVTDKKMRGPVIAVSLILWLLALWAHQFGAACLLAGGVAGSVTILWSKRRNSESRSEWTCLVTGYGVIALAVLAVTWSEFENRKHLPVGDFESRVTQYLVEREEPDALLVAGPDQLLLQAQTNHPVMSDMATLYHASYMPSLAPTIHKLFRDVYGIDFGEEMPELDDWQSAWRERRTEEWQRLGELYSFTWVISPANVKLDLPSVLSGTEQDLYRLHLTSPSF